METKIAVPQNNFKIILLHPKESLNIGSVARAMLNFGFDRLCLVAPLNWDRTRAEVTARKAGQIFDNLEIVNNISDAIKDCNFVYGFTIKQSKNTPRLKILDDWVGETHFRGTVGLLFGPEDTGLTYEDFHYCHQLVKIPASERYDSLNLAQAALLVFYCLAQKHVASSHADGDEPLAIGEQFLALDQIIEEIAKRSDFAHQGTPERTLDLLKNLFRRPELKHREMQILLGFFSRLGKSL